MLLWFRYVSNSMGTVLRILIRNSKRFFYSWNMDTFVHIQTVQNNEALKIFVLSLKFMWKEKHLNYWLQVRSLFNDNLSMHLALLYMKAYEASPDFRTRRSVSADYRWIGVWCRESNPSESDGVMYCFIRSAVQVFNKGAGNGT